jgi:hypothetical protein
MKPPALRVVIFGAVSAMLGAAAMAQTTPTASGHWEGEIQIPNQILGITVDLTRNPAGMWIGSMSVAGTTAVDVPLNDLSVAGTAVRFSASLPDATFFDGRLSADAATLAGRVSNELGGVPFTTTRAGEPAVKLPPPSTALTTDFEGAWEGSIASRGRTMRITLTLSRAADGTAIGALVNRDQGGQLIPMSTVAVHDRQLELEARAISGRFRGTLNASGQIAGEWSEGASHLPLTFERASGDAKTP